MKSAVQTFISFFKYPMIFIGIVIGIYLLIVLAFVVYGLCKGKRFKRGEHRPPKKNPLWKQLLVDAPKQFVDDMFDQDPDFFRYQGLVIYTGRQGMGKTVTMVRDMMLMQEEYPRCKCITNVDYKYQDDELRHWEQLISYKNGIYGVIVGLDEIQNWFSSKQSKDFPPQMFEVVTQNRKNRRLILATTQNYYQPAKDIRAQCTEVRKCMTFFGVWTLVHAVRPELDSTGDVKEWHHVKWYSFAHTKEIREAYDTYKVIESLMKSGFKEQNTIVVESGK